MMPGILSIQSHVVYGHAGNSSAVFPLQRMGFEVWPLHTVQFSNHTQYAQGWTGKAFSSDETFDLVRGLDNLDALANCQAVITGYQGSMEQCKTIVDTVSLVKERNPEALYVCDPVMGSPEKGCIVSPGIADTLIENVMPMADIVVPNQFELSQFTGLEINSIEEAIVACQAALTKGPKMVLVKHLHCISDSSFSMMLATKDNCYLAQRPHLQFVRDPVGVGDLITALFTAGILKRWEPEKAFGHSNNASYGILKETSSRGQWELQTIAAQQEIVEPAEVFPLQQLAFTKPQAA